MELSSLHSWLDALSSHSIFKQQRIRHEDEDDDETTFDTSSAASLPPSPDASSIHSLRRGHGGDESDAGYTQHERRASASSHSAAAGKSDKRAVACIARKTELCVAAGRKIRVMNLASYKTRMEHGTASSSSSSSSAHPAGNYKTLNTLAIDFEILQLIPSPSSRFLAIVGISQLVVLELPRKGWDGLVSSILDCSHDPIGPFYHSPSSPSISKVIFHPWGEHDSILLVLTSDGLLREYDILHDPDEPTQITDFCSSGTVLPSKGVSYGMSTPRKSSNSNNSLNRSSRESRSASKALVSAKGTPRHGQKHRNTMAFGDTDEGADVAVSSCIGEGEGDWSAFTLYCLMQNGDVYCVCPYLPKKARIPTDHLLQLASFISAKVDYISHNIGSLSLSERQILESRYSSQLKFINSLLSQRSSNNHMPSFSVEDDKDNEHDEEYITVKYPAYLSNPPIKQGPFLLQPSPRELENSEESLACDMMYVRLEDKEVEGELGCILLAYTDGKVDVCLDVEKVEAQWGRIGEVQAELPSLLVYESIDLFGAALVSQSTSGPVQIVKDPEYHDSFYLYHSHGAHSLSLRPIFDSLISSQTRQGNEEASIQQALRKQSSSEVAWLLQPSSLSSSGQDEEDEEELSLPNRVIALTAINDVYLGYALLLLTADGQLVSMELSFRSRRSGIYDDHSDSEGLPHHHQLSTTTRGLIEPAPSTSSQLTAMDRKAYVAFSDSSKFSLPPLLTRSSVTPTPRSNLPTSSSSRSTKVTEDGKISLTIESLRFVGETVERIDLSIKDLISAGNTVQERLELHLKELPRQVGKYHSINDKIKEKDENFGRYQERIEGVGKRQKELEKKADRILQKLIDNSQPKLSSFEIKWMEELDRVREAVEGSAGTMRQDKSLQNRAERLKEQLDLLRPPLEDLRVSNGQNGKVEERMGESQRKKIELGLAEEARLLKEARAKIEKMQAKLARKSLQG